MIIKNVGTEHPSEHWEFVECENSIVLDLGCGRWEKWVHRDSSWPTTPEFFIQKGAKQVYALDSDEEEINWFMDNIVPNMNVTMIKKSISSVDDIREILNFCNPDFVKCDIEGQEIVLLDLTDEEFSKVKFYAIETHSYELSSMFSKRFTDLDYTILAVIDLTHAHPMKVFFAKKN